MKLAIMLSVKIWHTGHLQLLEVYMSYWQVKNLKKDLSLGRFTQLEAWAHRPLRQAILRISRLRVPANLHS